MIITISRQLGSGGGRIGEIVAERLGFVYVDRDILRRAAEQAQVDEASLEDVVERRPSILELMSTAIVGYQLPLVPEYMPPEVFAPYVPTREVYRDLIEDVIRDVARRGDAVIVGRGGQVILRDVKPALHVYIYAPLPTRARRIAERESISVAEALQRAKESDRNRAGYLRSYYRAEWHDPGLYDLVINTECFTLEETADIVVKAAQTRCGSH